MEIKVKNAAHKSDGKNAQVDYYNLCPKCGNFSHIKEHHIYCSLCGTKLSKECPKCNTNIENPTAQFCVMCGERIIDLSDNKNEK